MTNLELGENPANSADTLLPNPEPPRPGGYIVTVPNLQANNRTPHEQLLMGHAYTIAEMREMRRQIDDKSRPVDEYQMTPAYVQADQQITLVPQFGKLNIRVEHILVTGPATQGETTIETEGSQTSPAANTQVVAIGAAQLQPGATYLVQWTVDLDGTVAAADENNFQLRVGSTTIENSANDGVVGHYPQEAIELTPGAFGFAIRTGGNAATAGAIYTAQLTVQPVTYSFSLQLGDRYMPGLCLNPQGVFELSPKVMLLSPQDPRIMTPAYPGTYNFEVMGWADERY